MFFEAIYKHAPPDAFIRWGPLERVVFGQVKDIFSGVLTTEGNDIFFSPAVKKGEDATKAGVLGSGVAWVDYDGKGSPTALLPPSFVVASGGRGHYHYYWLLDRFVKPDELEEINKALAAHMGEKGTWDCIRILRVPLSTNIKYSPPVQVKILEAHPELVYPPDVLKKLRPLDLKVLVVPPGKTRSERDWAITTLMLGWGIPEEYVKAALPTLSDKAFQEGEHYVNHTVERAARARGGIPQAVKARKKVPPREIANFYPMPVGWLVGTDSSDEGLILEIVWDEGQTRLSATQRDFESKRTINTMLQRNHLNSRVWLGTEKDASELWACLVDNCPVQQMLVVKQAGRHDLPNGQRVFVYGLHEALFHPEGISWPVFWVPPAESTLRTHLGSGDGDFLPTLAATVRTNRPEVIQPALGWTLAAPLKPVIERLDMRFPFLMLFGQFGSGKTTMIRDILLPLIGIQAVSLSINVTHFALLAGLSSYNALPLWLSEFEGASPNLQTVQSSLRICYDGGKEERGRPDMTVRTFLLTSPVVVDGRSLFLDSALRERTFPVHLAKADVTGDTEWAKALCELQEVRGGQADFARQYLQWTLSLSDTCLASLLQVGKRLFAQDVPYSRLADAAAVVWLGLELLDTFLDSKGLPSVLEPDEGAILGALCNSFVPGLGVLTPVERLCEVLAHCYRHQETWAVNACVLEEDVLWFNLTTVHHWMQRFWRELPDRDMLRPQVEERVGVYLKGHKSIEGGEYFGIDIAQAQALGMDIPQPKRPGALYG